MASHWSMVASSAPRNQSPAKQAAAVGAHRIAAANSALHNPLAAAATGGERRRPQSRSHQTVLGVVAASGGEIWRGWRSLSTYPIRKQRLMVSRS